MSQTYHVVVCAGIVPDPLQTLEPVNSTSGPVLKNEMMLPAVLDPWAAHALYEAADLARKAAGSPASTPESWHPTRAPPSSASGSGCPWRLASPSTPSSSSSLTGRRRTTRPHCLAGTSIGCSMDSGRWLPKRARSCGT